jgi:nitrite reductase (NO-forming)
MKKSLRFMSGLFLGMSLIVGACSGGSTSQTSIKEEPQEMGMSDDQGSNAAADAAMVAPADDNNRGEQIYKTKCIVCHQADGKGLPGAFPPLAQSDYLLKDKVRAVAQALNGSHMEIIVNGQKFNAPMPPQVDTKEDAVAVINYVLNNFGNKGGTVTLDEVKDVVINPRN